jgi:hypothetical protein
MEDSLFICTPYGSSIRFRALTLRVLDGTCLMRPYGSEPNLQLDGEMS